MSKPNSFSKDQYRGCLLGLACGDALCARYEGGFLERALWRLIGKTGGRLRFTDDTQMALDIIHSINHCGELDQDHLAGQFARSYRWSRGYGPGAAKTLKAIKNGLDWRKAARIKFQDGSYGNGAAMRAPVLTLFYDSELLKEKVQLASSFTHPHEEATEGAYLIALTVLLHLQKLPIEQILEELVNANKDRCFYDDLYGLAVMFYDCKFSDADVIRGFGNGMTARKSCVTAIGLALRYREKTYLSMVNAIAQFGGDADTIAAMAGAIWGAYHGYEAMQIDAANTIEAGQLMIELADQVFINKHAVI